VSTQSRIEPARVQRHERASTWQALWFALLRHKWTTLAVVPSKVDLSVHFVAKALSEVGKLHGVSKVHLVNSEGVYLADAARVIETVKDIGSKNEIALVAVDWPADNQAAIPIARACEAALLCVPLGGKTTDAHAAVDLVGRDRFIGSIAIQPRRS
jgi:hypothetical protein